MHELPITRTYQDLIYLLSCGIHDRTPETDRVQQMDLAQLFYFAQKHSVTSITAMTLEKCLTDPEALKPWIQEKSKAIRKIMLLDAERQTIFGYMDSKGIWHMPLKGVILKELYPKFGMRQMSDNDILFDPAYREEMHAYMMQLGYSCDTFGICNQDAYHKEPVYNIELHVSLTEDNHDKRRIAYYRDVKSRLIPDAPGSYSYHFSEEDFYLYMIVHAFKHYEESGTGIRTLLDIYVFLQKKQVCLDWDYIRREAACLGITAFEEQSRRLAINTFSSPSAMSLSEEDCEELMYYLESGAYGFQSQKRLNIMKKMNKTGSRAAGKLKYFLWRFFPPLYELKQSWTILHRKPWLYPVVWIVRLFRGIFVRRKALKDEAELILKSK